MQILNYDRQPFNSSIIAVFSVYIPEVQLTLHKLKLMKTHQGYLRVTFPCYSVPSYDEKKKWEPYFDFSVEKKREFIKEVLEALKPFLT